MPDLPPNDKLITGGGLWCYFAAVTQNHRISVLPIKEGKRGERHLNQLTGYRQCSNFCSWSRETWSRAEQIKEHDGFYKLTKAPHHTCKNQGLSWKSLEAGVWKENWNILMTLDGELNAKEWICGDESAAAALRGSRPTPRWEITSNRAGDRLLQISLLCQNRSWRQRAGNQQQRWTPTRWGGVENIRRSADIAASSESASGTSWPDFSIDLSELIAFLLEPLLISE